MIRDPWMVLKSAIFLHEEDTETINERSKMFNLSEMSL